MQQGSSAAAVKPCDYTRIIPNEAE